MEDLEMKDANSEPVLMVEEELDQVAGGVDEVRWEYYCSPDERDNPDGTKTLGYKITGEDTASGTLARTRFVAASDFEKWKTDVKRHGAVVYDGAFY